MLAPLIMESDEVHATSAHPSPSLKDGQHREVTFGEPHVTIFEVFDGLT